MIFRLSQRLNAKIKAGTLPALPLHESPLADWSAHLFLAGGTQYILLSNTPSLYSAVLIGKGVMNDTHFIERALSSIRQSLHDDGQESAFRRFIAPASASVRFARALDRSVTGSMNDLIRHATGWLAEGELSPREVGGRLNDILLSALARGSPTLTGNHGMRSRNWSSAWGCDTLLFSCSEALARLCVPVTGRRPAGLVREAGASRW